MYNKKEMNDGGPIEATIKLQQKYASCWREKSEWYWLWRLLQEVIELFFSLLGWHKDPAKWELMEIASICLNWMYKINNKEKK